LAKILVSPQSAFIPVIRELLICNHSIVTIEPNFAKTLRDLDLPSITALMEHITPANQSDALRNAAQTIHRLFSPFNTHDLDERTSTWLKSDLPAYAYSKVADLTLFAEAINSLNPDAILLHNDVEPLTRAAAQWGKHNHKPVFHIPHANYQEIENSGSDIHSIITATYILSSGSYQSAWYTKRRNSVDCKIIETGLPQFDDWARLNLNPIQARQSLGLDLDKPVITYASSWRQNTNLLGMHDGVEETYLAILEVAKRMSDVQFIVKCHPRGNNAQWHLDKAKELDVKGILITPHHLEPVLQSTNLLFAYGPSNILLEASHIPWIRLACTSGYEEDIEITKINTDPPDVDQITSVLYEILDGPMYNLDTFRRKYLGACDGLNYLRIVKVIETVLNNAKGCTNSPENTSTITADSATIQAKLETTNG